MKIARPLYLPMAFVLLVCCTGWNARGQEAPIQDNSFLIEEAYNQERGVVQHISTLSRMWNSKDWSYTFTQEWPGLRNPRHQFSYTLVGAHNGDFSGSGFGIGDVALHYRYQVAGDGESRVAFAPRLSILVPSGDVSKGRGAGAAGLQTNLPMSIALSRRLVSHTNAGATLIPHTQSADRCRAGTVGYSVGQSLVFLAHPRFNIMLEASDSRFQRVIANGRTEWGRVLYISPAIRWAYNLKSGLQIVPGVAVPFGLGPIGGERGVFLYLSFEHPMKWMQR